MGIRRSVTVTVSMALLISVVAGCGGESDDSTRSEDRATTSSDEQGTSSDSEQPDSESTDPVSSVWVSGSDQKIYGADTEDLGFDTVIEGRQSPGNIVSGFGSVWVSTEDELVRIDPKSADDQTISVPKIEEVVTGDDAMWASIDGGIQEVSPRSNRTRGGVLRSPDDVTPSGLSYDDGVVFGCGSDGGLLRFDTRTGAVESIDRTLLSHAGEICQQTLVVNDSLYVVLSGELQERAIEDLAFLRNYTIPQKVASVIPLPDGGTLAYAATRGRVQTIDLASGRLSELTTIDPGGAFPILAIYGDEVWAGLSSGDVVRLNPVTMATEVTATLPTSVTPAALGLNSD